MQQDLNMADTIRRPKQRQQDDDHDDESDKGSNRRGRKNPDDDDDDGSEEGGDDDWERNRKRNNRDEEDWKFDSGLLKPPKVYDGTDSAYFQPWLEMLKSEMMSKWELWGDILKVLDEVGQRRLDPDPVEISDIISRTKAKRTINRIKSELFRILKGMTSGDAQAAIVQGMTRDVFDAFRRPISKAKSCTKAIVRELTQRIDLPRKADDIADYDVAVAEWESNVAKIVAYRGQDTLFAQEDLLEAYCSLWPAGVMTFEQFKVDGSFEPDRFREEMAKYIYRKARGTKTTISPLANEM